jgi:hypothetical protein
MLMKKGQGGIAPRPPMLHPCVAVDYARWAKPEAAVEISKLLVRFLSSNQSSNQVSPEIILIIKEFLADAVFLWSLDEF